MKTKVILIILFYLGYIGFSDPCITEVKMKSSERVETKVFAYQGFERLCEWGKNETEREFGP